MIQNNGPVPEDWPNLAVFRPVCAERNRHNCVLLPFIALGQALTGMLGLSNKEFQ
jgi:NifU-like protein involved in Fe-S cluster formation